jgi:two-component system alkaline phosphatase synthesis response regulator PhoP
MKHILVIDDNEDILHMLKAMLQMKGFKVSLQLGALDIENDLRSIKPDMIIMDMLLSGADGREVCKGLKQNDEFSKTPLLMISAHPSARKDCLAAGADYFLEKPFDMNELFSNIDLGLADKVNN